MKRLLLTSLLLITFIGNVLADDVTFVASAPKSVVVNQRFRLTYTVNTTDAKEPVIGEIPGFELLMGPSISSESSYSNYNGQQTSSVSVTFTYVLLAKEEGTFTIPSAKITAAGKTNGVCQRLGGEGNRKLLFLFGMVKSSGSG